MELSASMLKRLRCALVTAPMLWSIAFVHGQEIVNNTGTFIRVHAE